MNFDAQPLWVSQPGPCCGPMAIHVVAKVPFKEAWDTVKQIGGYANNWKGRTTWTHLQIALTKLNVTWHHRQVRRGSITLRRWIDQHARPSGIYLVRVGGHFLVVDRMGCTDQLSYRMEPGLYWAKARRVTDVIEIA